MTIQDYNDGMLNAWQSFKDGYDFKTSLLEQFDQREWNMFVDYITKKLNINTLKELATYCGQLEGDIPRIQGGK